MTARFKLGGVLRTIRIGLFATLALGGAYLGTLRLTGNFNTSLQENSIDLGS
jgi:hypothetical protein